MGGFLLLMSLALGVMALIGVIRGRIWFLRSRGQSALGLLAALVLFIVSGAVLAASPPKSAPPARSAQPSSAPTAQNSLAPKTQSTGPSIETQRADFQTWYDKVMGIHDQADKAISQYQKVADALAKGGVTLVDAYSAIKSIRDTEASAQSTMFAIKPPTSLSAADQQKLKKATENLATGLFSRRTALDKVLRYMDEQKPSLIANAQDDLKAANAFMIEGIGAILEVQTALGIEAKATP